MKEQLTIEMWNNMVFGNKVSDYGLENGYLDYYTLGKIVGDCILNNTIREKTLDDWELINGEFEDVVYQDYIISRQGYEILKEFTDELVFYNEELDIYIWAITHFGTAWDYVLTNIKLVEVSY